MILPKAGKYWIFAGVIAALAARTCAFSDDGVTTVHGAALRPIPSYYFGVTMTQTINEPTIWSDPSFTSMIKKFHFGTIRYPGGTEANYWDWKTGNFVKHLHAVASPDMFHYVGRPSPHFGLEKLALATNVTGTTPLFDLNVITASLQNQLSMLREAKANNIPVQLAELGNELYWNFRPLVRRYPNSRAYAREASIWGQALHEEFPGIKVAAVAADVPMGKPRIAQWNQGLTDLHHIDALAIHSYIHLVPTISLEELQHPTPETIKRTIGLAFTASRQLEHHIRTLPGTLDHLPIWITEYGIWAEVPGKDQINKLKNDWAVTLTHATLCLLLMQNPRVDMIVNIHLVGPFAENNVIKFHNGANMSVSGSILYMASNAASQASSIRSLIFEDVKKIEEGDRSYSSLVGVEFVGDKNCVMIVNLADQPQRISLHELVGPQVAFIQMDEAAEHPVVEVNHLKGEATDGVVLLPPYSISFIWSR